MQDANMKYLISTAQNLKSPVTDVIQKSTEVGIVVPSVLKKNLVEAGYKVITEQDQQAGMKPLRVLKRVVVQDGDGAIVAMGMAGDEGEALVHAMLGYVREEVLKATKAA